MVHTIPGMIDFCFFCGSTCWIFFCADDGAVQCEVKELSTLTQGVRAHILTKTFIYTCGRKNRRCNTLFSCNVIGESERQEERSVVPFTAARDVLVDSDKLRFFSFCCRFTCRLVLIESPGDCRPVCPYCCTIRIVSMSANSTVHLP